MSDRARTGEGHRRIGEDVSFSILGPLEVQTVSGAQIRISSPQERMLLAALLIEWGRVVGTDALIDALWPNDPPASAQNALQVNVSKLRNALEPDRERGSEGLLVTRPSGYLLDVVPRQLDAVRFDRLVAAGRAALSDDMRRARGCLEGALALWRGPPLGELGSEPFALPWVAKMEELRLYAIEGLVDARLALGDHSELAAELATLVVEHPLRERFRAQQMLALYRCGRAPEALAAYRRARAALLHELGLEPGPELRALERAILRQDPELSLRPPAAPAALTATVDEAPVEPALFACALRQPTPHAGLRSLGDWEIGLVVEEHGGRLLTVEGGRVSAAFHDAASAVAAATALAADPECPARVALHAGDAVALGGSYIGAAPTRVQRLAAAAHPGQVLLSAAAAELARGELPDGYALLELGAPRLADLGRPETLHQLAHHRLTGEFPPLRALDDVPNNLPVYPDPFVGRKAELAEVARLLERTRLLTLTGPGGCGKTRLAMQAAAELLPTLGGGAFAVQLAALSDPRLVVGALASALGLPENPRMPMIDVVTRHLADHRVLVLLDTCEHLLGACAELAEGLTATCPEIRVLATSRERLGARGELVWEVPPLSLPAAVGSGGDGEPVPDSDAVRLLIERASALSKDLRVGSAESEAAARICRRLAGLPLAIELAAAQLPAFGLDHIAQRLEAGADSAGALQLLRDPRTSSEARHKTMERALDWSFGLLTTEERLLIARFAVFAGVFTLEDAESVAGGAEFERVGVSSTLARLVGRSLVATEDAGEGRVRYRLLDPIRDYAALRLDELDTGEELRRRHAEWFVALAEEADARLHGPDERVWLERLDAAHDNLRASLSWAIEGGVANVALRLAGAMWWFWYTRGHLAEGRDWLERALALPAPAAARVKSLVASSHLAAWHGDYGKTIARCEEVLAHPDEDDDRWGRGWASMGLAAIVTLTQDDLDRALSLAEESVALLRELDRDWELGYAIATLGLTLLYREEYDRAAEAFDDCIRIQRALGQPDLGLALRYRGLVAGLVGDGARAAALCEESLALASTNEDRSGVAQSLNLLAAVARYEGDLDRARPLFAEALETAHEMGEFLDVRWALDGLAGVACRDGLYELATRLLAKADAIASLASYRPPPAERATHAADVQAARADLRADEFEAAWAAGESMSLDQAVTEALGLADSDRSLLTRA